MVHRYITPSAVEDARTGNQWYVQSVAEAKDKKEAEEIFASMQLQTDYRGGRILAPSPAKPGWRVQTFHEDCGEHDGRNLPDGLRRVIILKNQRQAMGILQ